MVNESTAIGMYIYSFICIYNVHSTYYTHVANSITRNR